MNPLIRLVSRHYIAFLAGLCLSSLTTVWAIPQPTIVLPLHTFATSDGYNPVLSLVAGPDNVLYGTTPRGGADIYGTVFKLNRDGSGFSVIHSFSAADIYPAPTIIPGAQIIRGRDGVLYGTASGGTNYPSGMIFKINTDGSGYTILHGFTNADNGPLSLMQASDGFFYGAGLTCVFKLDTDGNNYAVLHTFNGSIDGHAAYGKLTQGSDGALYGANQYGGTNSTGTVFKLNTDGAGFNVLYTFGPGTDGRRPYGGVIQCDDGALYGTTTSGGSNNYGTVFKLSTDGSVYQTLHHFAAAGTDGAYPYGALVQGLNHFLYGTTSAGGVSGAGTIFEMGLDGSAYAAIYHFGTNLLGGSTPYSGLVPGPASDGSGVLYGTAFNNGNFSLGTVFGMIVNPPLSIAPTMTQSGGMPVVTWPAWALNYVLQTTTNLQSGTWDSATNGVPVTGLQLTNSTPGAYYRLIWQQ